MSLVHLGYFLTIVIACFGCVRWSKMSIDEDSIVRGVIAMLPTLLLTFWLEDHEAAAISWLANALQMFNIR